MHLFAWFQSGYEMLTRSLYLMNEVVKLEMSCLKHAITNNTKVISSL